MIRADIGSEIVRGGADRSLGSWSGDSTPSQESIAALEDGTAPLALETRARLR
jgi:hypothetical protein